MSINYWLLIAGVLSFVATMVHAIVGGKMIAKPVRDVELARLPLFTTLYVWYITTFVLAMIAVGYIYSAIAYGQQALAVGLTITCGYAVALNLFLRWRYKAKFHELPQWTLLGIITILGVIGSWYML